jgi:hypothetical protein
VAAKCDIDYSDGGQEWSVPIANVREPVSLAKPKQPKGKRKKGKQGKKAVKKQKRQLPIAGGACVMVGG